MRTTLIGKKQTSDMQEMGETREPMARDCWKDANRLAEMYSKSFDCDFWILYAAKPHATIEKGIVCGWEVVAKRPRHAMVGVLVFKWSNKQQSLLVESDLCLPYDVPISDMEMSSDSNDFVPEIERAAKKSGSILLA